MNNEEATPSINANGNLTGSPTFYIGGDNQLNSEMFYGAIDDFRIYAHALNPKEREDAFNFVSSALVATFGEDYSYHIETLKGPTEFNATGLREGLFMDPNKEQSMAPQKKQDWISTLLSMHPIPLVVMRRI